MEKAEIKQIVADEIKKFLTDSLDKEVKKLLHANGSASRDELIKTIANSFEIVYKNLWLKRGYWTTDLK